jgi:hypothetical protein
LTCLLYPYSPPAVWMYLVYPFPPPAVWIWCIPFHRQQYVPPFTNSSVNMQVVFQSFACSVVVQGVCISFLKCRNAGLSGIQSVRYRTTKIADSGTSPVLE